MRLVLDAAIAVIFMPAEPICDPSRLEVQLTTGEVIVAARARYAPDGLALAVWPVAEVPDRVFCGGFER
jgi:hypothetical protein